MGWRSQTWARAGKYGRVRPNMGGKRESWARADEHEPVAGQHGREKKNMGARNERRRAKSSVPRAGQWA